MFEVTDASQAGSRSVAFGKVRAEGDFIWVGTGSQTTESVRQWLHRAYQRADSRVPAQLTCFLFRPPQAPGLVAGAFARSQDSVGRAFPLCVCTELGRGFSWSDYPTMPYLFSDYLSAAGALCLADWDSQAALLDALTGLPEPRPEKLGEAAADCAWACAEVSAGDWWQQVTGRVEVEVHGYALFALREACAVARRAAPWSPAGVTLHCSAATSFDLYVWLRLLRAHLGDWQGVPTMAWQPYTGKVWLALGAPPDGLLRRILQPDTEDAGLWPVTTEQAAARASAVAQLPPPVRRAIAASGSVDALLRLLEEETVAS